MGRKRARTRDKGIGGRRTREEEGLRARVDIRYLIDSSRELLARARSEP